MYVLSIQLFLYIRCSCSCIHHLQTHTTLSFSCSCLLLLKNLHASIPCSEETELSTRCVFSSWFCSGFVEAKTISWRCKLGAEAVGHGGCGQVFVWDFRECHCSISLSISGAYFLEDHSEQIHGGILRGAIQHDAAQLPPLRLVRAAVRVPEQRPGVDDQRRGRSDRDSVRGALPRIRVEQEGEAPDARPGVGRRGGVRGRRARLHARLARSGTQAPRRPRHDRLLHLHVRLAALHHEDGDQDEERGVHAVPAVAGGVPVRHVVVHLRLARPRPLRHDPQRVWERPGRRAAHPVRRLPEQQGERCRGRQAARRQRGDVRRRQEQQGRRRRRQRCQGVDEGRQDGQPGLARSIDQAAILCALFVLSVYCKTLQDSGVLTLCIWPQQRTCFFTAF